MMGENMILRQIFDHQSSTYTYLIADPKTRNACIIDPVKEHVSEYLCLCNELELNLILALDTHVHADHITALGLLQDKTQCETRVGLEGDVSCAHGHLVHNHLFLLGNKEDGVSIRCIHTPGHTRESFCFYVTYQNGHWLFTGDTLLIRGTGRTDFQAGDAKELYESIFQKLFSLPACTTVYPGHDYNGRTTSTLREERLFSPRLQLSESAFIEHMNNLQLPDPKLMDTAVPANLGCGKINLLSPNGHTK